MLKRLILFVLLFGTTFTSIADETNPAETSKGTLKGFVYDEKTSQPLEYATISLANQENGQVVNGTITDQTGFFKLKNIDPGTYKIDITFIGYNTKSFDNVIVEHGNREVDLGKVILEPAVQEIDEAVVVADRPTLTYKIDKKVINVSQQHTSASGTAVEILENIPSITVDIEGNVSLRGSESFTVLIDNKPTVLEPSDALSQIPASAIENIEIITNPSAKYDPDGTSGIINIITKKEKLQGFSGVMNANAGMYDRYGADFLINWRRERLSFFVGGDVNNRGFEGNRTSENWTITGDTTSYILSDGDFSRGGISYSVRGGADWTLNPQNSINFEARVGYRERTGSSLTDYQEYTIPATSQYSYLSDEESNRGGWYSNYSLGYTHKFLRQGHQLYALLNYRTSNSDEESINELIDASNAIVDGQRSLESGPSNDYRIQLDYTLPLREEDKFEAGYNLRIENSNDLSEMYQYNPDPGVMEYEYMDEYRNDIDYKRDIHGIYTTYSGKIGSFGYQGGLRGEYTYRNITLTETGESAIIDRFDIFPTIHFSYTTPKENQFMASYSRRIERPRGWYLEPFITWSDAYNVRQGNPDLKPEYIDSYELSHITKFGTNSFSVDAYYRITNNKIERTRSVYDENVFLSSFENVGKDYALGVELMLGLDIFKWWHVDLMGNLYDYKVEGELFGQDFSESSFNWNTRFNNTLRFGKYTRLQLNGMYNSPTISAQGERDGFFMTNLALRRSFLKNKLAATLQVRDVFGTMSHASTYQGDDFYSHYNFDPNTPIITLTLTYKINNYKPDRRGSSEQEMDGMDEGSEF